MIRLDEIKAGDTITVQDQKRNVLVAPVATAPGQIVVEAFGTFIQVCRLNKMGRLVEVAGVRIVGHQPDLGLPL